MPASLQAGRSRSRRADDRGVSTGEAGVHPQALMTILAQALDLLRVPGRLGHRCRCVLVALALKTAAESRRAAGRLHDFVVCG
jgi:hypothetical protein